MRASTRRFDLLRTRLDRLTRTLHGVAQAEPRAVHRARVASRRLRELLPVLQLDPASSRKLGRRLRKVTRTLGPLREADVMLALVDELQTHGSGLPDADGAPGVRRAWRHVALHVRRRRDQTLEDISPQAAFAELRRAGRKLEEVARRLDREDDGGGRRGWRWAIDARIARRAALLDAAMGDAGAVYLPERLHAVRIAVKKLRYAVELAADARGSRTSPELRTLKRAQEQLGRLRDFEVLIGRVRDLQAASAPHDRATRGDLDALVTALEHACRRLHGSYVRQRRVLAALAERFAGHEPAAHAAARRAG